MQSRSHTNVRSNTHPISFSVLRQTYEPKMDVDVLVQLVYKCSNEMDIVLECGDIERFSFILAFFANKDKDSIYMHVLELQAISNK